MREHLGRLGTECFLPSEWHRHTRGRRSYEHPLIPGMIFLRTTKQHACELTNDYGLQVRYLMDPASRTLLVVPDKQMDDFRRVLDMSGEEDALCEDGLALGDYVRVIKGALRGVEGRILEFKGRVYVVVELLGSFFAKANVPRTWLEVIDTPESARMKWN